MEPVIRIMSPIFWGPSTCVDVPFEALLSACVNGKVAANRPTGATGFPFDGIVELAGLKIGGMTGTAGVISDEATRSAGFLDGIVGPAGFLIVGATAADIKTEGIARSAGLQATLIGLPKINST